jgi:hypothetical protein
VDPKNEPVATDDSDETVRDVLSGFNAEDLVDDPSHVRPDEDGPPAATPDSPNPI